MTVFSAPWTVMAMRDPYLDALEQLDQMRDRAFEAEATIQRVRELHYNTATHHPSGCCSECGGTYPCPTVRAFDGGAE